MVKSTALRSILLIVCVAAGPWNGTLFAAGADGGGETSSAPPHVSLDLTRVSFGNMPPPPPAPFASAASITFAQRGWWRRGRGNSGAKAAVILGAAAAIAGAAVLVYANRPDCRTDPSAGGCGYGSKVIGGSLIAGGAVGIVVGALSWR